MILISMPDTDRWSHSMPNLCYDIILQTEIIPFLDTYRWSHSMPNLCYDIILQTEIIPFFHNIFYTNFQ